MKIVPIRVQVETKDLHIAALGDIQFGNEGFSVKALTGFLTDMQEDSKGSTLSIIGTGDYVDAMTPSNRKRYRASGLYASAKRGIEDKYLLPLVLDLYDDYLKPFREHFAGLCMGHHWFNYEWGVDEGPESAAERQRLEGNAAANSDEHLAKLLGCQAAKSHMLVSYEFPSGKTYNVLAWHGEGNGVTLTYGLNKLVRKSGGWEGIDAILMGHTHKLGGVAETRLRPTETEILARNIPLVNSGSYLRGYLINETTYVEEYGLNALALGGAMLRVRGVKKGFRNRISLYV